jgi:hypothetical protein
MSLLFQPKGEKEIIFLAILSVKDCSYASIATSLQDNFGRNLRFLILSGNCLLIFYFFEKRSYNLITTMSLG